MIVWVLNMTLVQVFFCEFWDISRSTFFTEHLRWLPLDIKIFIIMINDNPPWTTVSRTVTPHETPPRRITPQIFAPLRQLPLNHSPLENHPPDNYPP